MAKKETLSEFYRQYFPANPAGERLAAEAGEQLFSIYRREDQACLSSLPPLRRDFFKISLLIKGSGILRYADKSVEIRNHALTFSNPNVPYSWEGTSEDQTGYFCIFREDFVAPLMREQHLHDSLLFRPGGDAVYFLSGEQSAYVGSIFERMLHELNSAYTYKYDLLRTYTALIMHEALKFRPVDAYFKERNAASRISQLFTELLERQFPIEDAARPLTLRTAHDYANQLSVHVNHLNRAVKEATGKTTSGLIADRIMLEARSLLRQTNWSIAEIAYSLGFEYPSYFNNFFKKHSGVTPRSLRPEPV
jgi:AraC family transcriptional activator of pobA